MKDQYVILTGSKNNAGDFLIKFRAKQLFSLLRPDRDIIDYNGWESLTNEKLDVINDSKALILMGGPALVENMVPQVYNLPNNLDDIRIPIITMGIGWKSQKGNWDDTYNYKLSNKSIELLERIEESGYQSSVRDYHTLSAIRFHGLHNFIMTGCPAYYDHNYINTEFKASSINKVAFSLGVSFVKSSSMARLIKQNILACKERFNNIDFKVVFHHSLDEKRFQSVYNTGSAHVTKHNKFADWLKENDISYIDVSGSAEKLIDYYADVDLHIGYRVHAHIFMNSIGKMSILISEDGRAKGVKGVINGIVLDAYSNFRDGFTSRVLNKLFSFYDRFIPNNFLTKELLCELDYEMKIDYARIKSSRKKIDNQYLIMKRFLKQLP